jgi:tRNA nucleotidyltransferase (CCA-adding enzyme)
MLRRLEKLDLLKPVHPALGFDESARARLERTGDQPPSVIPDFSLGHLRWMSWLMDLSIKELESLNQRLHFTTALFDALKASSRLLSALSSFVDLKPSGCVERLEGLPLPAVYAVSLAAQGKSKQKLEKYLGEWRHVKPHTTGHDLKKLGLEPGPRYRKILRQLRNAWLDGEIQTAQDEMELLVNLLRTSV